MRRILSSLLTVVAVALVAVGATTAFFTDVETSSDNTFQSGALDLKIDNTSYLNSGEDGAMVLIEGLSWDLRDLSNELFFSYRDVKPGDLGEDTVSLHVFDNDAWACMDILITENDDESCTDPEQTDDPTCNEPDFDLTDGDLANDLQFIFWVDDGDNVLEEDEVGSIFANGSASTVLNSTWTLADAGDNNVGGVDGDPLTASTDYFIGKAWCFGDLTPSAVPPDRDTPGIPDDDDDTPEEGPSGVSCDGSQVDNASQTDVLMGDITFRAEQWRNNPTFTCVQ